MRPRNLWILVVGLLPASRAKNKLLSLASGVSVSSRAHIGPIGLLTIRRLEVGADASIALGSVFRNLDTVRVSESSTIGSWNWITGAPMFTPFNADLGEGRLIVGPSSAITSRHYMDCTGGITIGRFTTIGGVRSTWLSHRINLDQSVQFSAGIHVGDRCFTSSGVQVGPGVSIANNSVVAMGAVVTKSLDAVGRLFGGVPARDLGAAKNAAYVRRTVGRVDRGDVNVNSAAD